MDKTEVILKILGIIIIVAALIWVHSTGTGVGYVKGVF